MKVPENTEKEDLILNFDIIRHTIVDDKKKVTEKRYNKAKEKGKNTDPDKLIGIITSSFDRGIKTGNGIAEGVIAQIPVPKDHDKNTEISDHRLAPPSWNGFDKMLPALKDIHDKEGDAGICKFLLSGPKTQENLKHWAAAIIRLIKYLKEMIGSLHKYHSPSKQTPEFDLILITHDIIIVYLMRELVIWENPADKEKINYIDFLDGFTIQVYSPRKYAKKRIKIFFHNQELKFDQEKYKFFLKLSEDNLHKGRTDRENWKE